jgi:hypothetical protein
MVTVPFVISPMVENIEDFKSILNFEISGSEKKPIAIKLDEENKFSGWDNHYRIVLFEAGIE